MFFFFFNDTATTEIYTLSLHDALPICGHLLFPGRALRTQLNTSARAWRFQSEPPGAPGPALAGVHAADLAVVHRSEEHTSELQSRQYLVCRLLLEKKKEHSHSLLVHIQ